MSKSKLLEIERQIARHRQEIERLEFERAALEPGISVGDRIRGTGKRTRSYLGRVVQIDGLGWVHVRLFDKRGRLSDRVVNLYDKFEKY